MLRRLVRRVILWAVPETGGYAEGGVVRPLQENQDTVKLVAKKFGYERAYTDQDLEDMQESWDRFVKRTVTNLMDRHKRT